MNKSIIKVSFVAAFVFAALYATSQLNVKIIKSKKKPVAEAAKKSVVNRSTAAVTHQKPQIQVLDGSRPKVMKTPALQFENILKKYTKTAPEIQLKDDVPKMIYGFNLPAELTDSDANLQNLVTELASELIPGTGAVVHSPEERRNNGLELVDDFNHTLEGLKVYNSYFRTFRNSENLQTTFLINELVSYNEIESRALFDEDDAVHKMKTYFSPFGKEFNVESCRSKVYFVKADKVAQLSYLCRVTVFETVPTIKEMVVSATSLDVLYQSTKTIIN